MPAVRRIRSALRDFERPPGYYTSTTTGSTIGRRLSRL